MQNCRIGLVCIYQVPAGCKVEDNTDVYANICSNVNPGARLERSMGYMLEAVFRSSREVCKEGGVAGCFQARPFSRALALMELMAYPTLSFFLFLIS